MRASRLLSLLLLLQTRGRLTAREIADELDVSVRTIYRDLESLMEAGVPVLAERGAAGGYRLLAGYRTRLTGLTSDEADSLFLAGMPDAAAELGFGAVAAAAELKLLAALPPQARERATRVRDRFHLDAPGWSAPPRARRGPGRPGDRGNTGRAGLGARRRTDRVDPARAGRPARARARGGSTRRSCARP